MSERAIDRLRTLREEGVALSRNRNFRLFSELENRQALSLHRYLDALADEILEGHQRDVLRVGLVQPQEGPVRLDIYRSDLAVHHTAHLDQQELAELAERHGVRDALEARGVSVSELVPTA